jgi:hypothetical protein
VPQVDRSVRTGRHDANAGRHFSQRLAACCERDEVPSVLHEEKRDEGRLGKDADIGGGEAADLHREVDHDRVGDGEHRRVDEDGDDAGADAGRLCGDTLPACDRGATWCGPHVPQVVA